MMKHFISDEFTWTGNKGVAEASSLFGNVISEFPSTFSITSTKTGKCRFYERVTLDDERAVYTDNLWDGTRVTIIND